MTPVICEQGTALERGQYGNFKAVEADAHGNIKTTQGTTLHVEHDTQGGSVLIMGQEFDTEIEVKQGHPPIIAKSLRHCGHLSILLEPGDQVLVDDVRLTGK